MRWLDKVGMIRSMAQVKFSDRQIPLWLSWPVTNRCNYRCSYCGRPSQADRELSTGRTLEIVDEFAALGTRFVFLSGGEPLVRADLPDIVERCRRRGLFVCLTTNGALYLKRKKEIGRVDMLKVSLDGPEPVHDRYRAAGSFARVIRVLEDAGRDRLPVILNPVVSRATLPHLDDLVDLARRYNAILKFQPINHLPAGNRNILDLMLDGDQYGSLSARLGELKMRTRVVGNTHSGIRYLGCLPGGGPMKCFAGRLFVYLAPDGNLFPCNRRQEVAEPQSCAEAPVSHALRNLPRVECRTCWCTSDAELNLMMRLDPRDVFGSFRMAVERGI